MSNWLENLIEAAEVVGQVSETIGAMAKAIEGLTDGKAPQIADITEKVVPELLPVVRTMKKFEDKEIEVEDIFLTAAGISIAVAGVGLAAALISKENKRD